MKYILSLALLAASTDAGPETMPPLHDSTMADGFEIPSHCAFIYGDPHIFTYDQKKMDCQGEGDYILSKSYDSDFEIQGRFIKGTEEAQERIRRTKPWELGTTNQGLVINTGVAGEPVVEIDADVFGNGWGEGDCNMLYKFNGQEMQLGADEELFGGAITFQRRSAWERKLWISDAQRHVAFDENNVDHKTFDHNNHRNFFFRKSGVFVQVTKRFSHDFGCFLNARICLPESITKQELRGVLGNANGNPNDDYITRFGSQLGTNDWSAVNDYCVENWCVKDDASSMFENSQINRECKAYHDEQLEEAIKNASDEIKNACFNDIDCITDAIITGDIEEGLATLQAKSKKDDVKDCEKKPEDEVEEDTCMVGGKAVPCTTFKLEGEFKCEAAGYDFGYRMDGCDPNAEGPFSDLIATDQNPTCSLDGLDVGSFDISCKARTSTGDHKRAVITPTVDAVIKVSGKNGGTLYKDLKKGEKYVLTTGTGANYENIEDIEFCFKCPKRVVDRQLVSCQADVKTCPDGTQLARDPSDQCAFPACPEVEDACALPAQSTYFSVITKAWANISAHSMYKGISIGGLLTDASPGQDGTIDSTISYVKRKNSDPNKFKFNFNGGVQYGTEGVDQKFWKKIEYLTKHAKSGTMGEYKVVVVEKGGEYNLYDFRNGGQGYDKGKTLVIFNTDEEITITKSKDGRQFGPTIIAPFAHVKVLANAGFVDGAVIAKTLQTFGGSLQLHGDIYSGKIPCQEGDDSSDDSPSPDEAPAPSPDDSPSPDEPSPEDPAPSPDDGSGMKAPPKDTCAMPDQQCGGNGWTGPTTCTRGWYCKRDSEWWSACKPKQKEPGTCDAYAKCGGKDYKGPTTCTPGYYCDRQSEWHSQCEPDKTKVCAGAPGLSPSSEEAPEPSPSVEEPVEPSPSIEEPVEPSPSIEEPVEPSPSVEDTPKVAPPAPDSPSVEDRTTDRAFTKGDPHFKTFGGELYDYHGECDLVLLHNPDFKEGLGMDIHIRTKIEDFWSSVESAVIKLGDETLEIKAEPGSDEWLWHNGKEVTRNMEDGWNRGHLSGYLYRYKQSTRNVRDVFIHLKGSKEILVMKTFKSFVRVDINWQESENYYNSVGLLGSHAHNGKRLGRDGVFIENVNAFGQEWQVRPEVDGALFHTYEDAVVGKKCVMPPEYHEGDNITVASLRGRRLGASSLTTEMAEKACNHLVDAADKKACVYDVIATQDLSMASS